MGSVACMEWTEDVSAGDWIRARLDDGPAWDATMHGVIPRGFPAYARLFHPGLADDTAVTWAAAAAAFGTEMHGTAQWNRIVRRGGGGPHARDADAVKAPDGRVYSAPQPGRLDAPQLSATARHLAAHTSTPEDVYIAVWEGWGGMLGFFGEAPARATLTLVGGDDDPELFARHSAMLARSIHDPFNNVFRKPVWQPGLLSDEISRGPRLRLPHRDHVLFRGSIADFVDPGWASRVPWAEDSPDWTASPSLIWPADRAWILVTEVDDDSTIIGGSPDLIRELCTDPALEAHAVREGADLSWDADEVNR